MVEAGEWLAEADMKKGGRSLPVVLNLFCVSQSLLNFIVHDPLCAIFRIALVYIIAITLHDRGQ